MKLKICNICINLIRLSPQGLKGIIFSNYEVIENSENCDFCGFKEREVTDKQIEGYSKYHKTLQ